MLSRMADYEKEKWFDLYRTALLELKRAVMTGRISDARAGISARLETLEQHPGLHQREDQSDAGRACSLRTLEQAEARLVEEERKRLLQEAMQKLQTLAPKLEKPKQRETQVKLY
jgi:hypothetical protein